MGIYAIMLPSSGFSVAIGASSLNHEPPAYTATVTASPAISEEYEFKNNTGNLEK